VLSGVDAATLAAAERTGAATTQHQSRVAPFIDLGAIPPGETYIDQLSRNARAQLRRSDRAYAATGPLRIERARTVAEGLQFLDALIVLHTATWRARGRPGAFATPVVRAFHQALVRRGIPGEVALFRITAGSTAIGYLYNLEHEGRACTYQSGFDYPGGGGTPMKPGLTCHHLAIEAHRAGGGTEYDFLGGADRYKLSLATSTRPLHWLTLTPHWHPAALMDRFRR
ncbi:MAG: GNAT family N-acetyltransferase, partial [Gemmatimonadaceae bacterium]|nr:GNAT family N-acetyltransferase [Acetobacteraceae bacterium]